MCNDKGSTWAYSTPGYGAALVPAHLRLMREAACAQGEDARTRSTTEVRPDPPTIRTRSTEVRSARSPRAFHFTQPTVQHQCLTHRGIGRPVDSMRVVAGSGQAVGGGEREAGSGRRADGSPEPGGTAASPRPPLITLHSPHPIMMTLCAPSAASIP